MSVYPWDEFPASGPLLRAKDAAKYIGVSSPHYRKMAAEGLVPKFISLSPRAKGVPRLWLDAVIAARASEVS